MFANVVSMSGDYTCTLPDEEAAINPCVTVKAAVTNHGVTEEKFVPNYRVTYVQEGGKSKARLENLKPWPNKQRGVTTSPQESDNHRQAQSKQKGVTTDPQPEENCTKKATEEEGAMYNQDPAYLTNQVQYSTVTNVMLPSLSCTTTTLVPVDMSTMNLVQMREELAIMPLATIPTNLKKDDDTAKVLTSRLDITIASVWEHQIATGPLSRSRILRPRGLI